MGGDENTKKSRSSTGKRKFHLKSRSGCSTCKKRRVKCDETKPICKRCEKTKIACGYTTEGYPPDDVNSFDDANDVSPSGQKKRRLSSIDSTANLISDNDDGEHQTLLTPPSTDLDLTAADISAHGTSSLLSVPLIDVNKHRQQRTPKLSPVSRIPRASSPSRQILDRQNDQATSAPTPINPINTAGSESKSSKSHLEPSDSTASNINDPRAQGSGVGANSASSAAAASATAAATAAATTATATNAASAAIAGIPQNILSAFSSGLLNIGSLNNINLSHLVNNLASSGADLGGLASMFASSGAGGNDILSNLSNLSNLATMAQFPLDLSNIIDQPGTESTLGGVTSTSAIEAHLTNDSQGPHTSVHLSDTPSLANVASAFINGASIPSSNTDPSIEPKLGPGSAEANASSTEQGPSSNPGGQLNMMDLRLMFHYTSQVSQTITGAGISDTNIWNTDIPMLAFDHPFLMHSLLAFSATHLSRSETGLDHIITAHRGDALRLLREAVLDINPENTDALVASALILIMDSLANASLPSSTSPKSLPALAWIFHVKGAATILTAVWPLTESRSSSPAEDISIGRDDGFIDHSSPTLASPHTINMMKQVPGMPETTVVEVQEQKKFYTDLECHDSEIADLFPVEINSPYLITLAYLNKLHKERYKSDFILRIFAFPALLEKQFMSLLMMGDVKAMRIMRSYYKLLRSFTTEMKDKVWFLEGVSLVLPVDVEEYAGGAGGMYMMLDFLGGGPVIIENDDEMADELHKFDPSGVLTKNLEDTDNLPSEITSNLEVMQGDSGLMNFK
ncbi:uncharacterized protein KQ657_000202 [Scheffersomyces spartinae]|uniref:Zn(2)-C6 fungal-type domain-containing protein n=1 Tax=Scheffersomyces spartinae TaxID=45513 RepID=A0A9P7VE70_9ASCO|nr:uncharacterized protein KQ657_000202 [Scheffersomyces spartinae]KAG7196190.1 hypothetical protein KQ657_000202 [Scheffersomyces spartinae]